MIEEKKSSILLVEDEENLHEALKLNLELEGYFVTSACNGAAALKAVQSEYFDLIIMDVMIPEMDGINVTETIRLNNNEVPILILSARNSSADRVLGLKKGADDYLTKPFNLEELLLRVQKLINKNKRAFFKFPSIHKRFNLRSRSGLLTFIAKLFQNFQSFLLAAITIFPAGTYARGTTIRAGTFADEFIRARDQLIVHFK